jgi:DNA-binding Lrp family transcriptional regulator
MLAKHIASAMSDELSRRILFSALSAGRSAKEISVEQAVPLSSCYRRIRELVDQGLLLVERIIVTAGGKRYALYRSSFRTVEMFADFDEVSVSAELNAEVAEKFRQKWLYLSYPGGR